jgi:hypothetical protein
MKSKNNIALIKSYLLTLAGSAACLLIIFLLFNDIITADSGGTFVYFIMGTLLMFFIQVPVALFYLVPISLLEEKRIQETVAVDLIKRYLPLPVLIMSLFVSSVFLLVNEDTNSMQFFAAVFLFIYCIISIQLSSYIIYLKS